MQAVKYEPEVAPTISGLENDRREVWYFGMRVMQQTGLRIVVRECPRAASPFHVSPVKEEEVHIWHASPAIPPSVLDLFAGLLTEDERSRAMRFRFAADQKSFLFCRGMLRILLASYLGTSAAELSFTYSAHGKPSLAASLAATDLEFNLSHSARSVLFGVCRGRRIGVDVEHIRRDFNAQEIAGRFFSAAERRDLLQLAETSRYDAFFRCWTRKEAFVKARGEGLSYPLQQFDVSVAPDDEEVALTTRPDRFEAHCWSLRSLNFIPGYAAALAIECNRTR